MYLPGGDAVGAVRGINRRALFDMQNRLKSRHVPVRVGRGENHLSRKINVEIRSRRASDSGIHIVRSRYVRAENERVDIHHRAVDRIVLSGRKVHSFAERQTAAAGETEIFRSDESSVAAHLAAIERKIGIFGVPKPLQNRVAPERQRSAVGNHAAVPDRVIFVRFKNQFASRDFHIGIFREYRSPVHRRHQTAAHPENAVADDERCFKDSADDIEIRYVPSDVRTGPMVLHLDLPAASGKFENLSAVKNKPAAGHDHIMVFRPVDAPFADDHLGILVNVLNSAYDRDVRAREFQASVRIHKEIRGGALSALLADDKRPLAGENDGFFFSRRSLHQFQMLDGKIAVDIHPHRHLRPEADGIIRAGAGLTFRGNGVVAPVLRVAPSAVLRYPPVNVGKSACRRAQSGENCNHERLHVVTPRYFRKAFPMARAISSLRFSIAEGSIL